MKNWRNVYQIINDSKVEGTVSTSDNNTSVLSHFSRVWLFATLWIAACQAPLSLGNLQARMLEWIAMPSSRGSSLPRIQSEPLMSPHWQAGSLPLVPPGEAFSNLLLVLKDLAFVSFSTSFSPQNKSFGEKHERWKLHLKNERDFPDGLVAKILYSQCRRPWFNPWAGN